MMDSGAPNDLTLKAERVVRLGDEMSKLLDAETDLLSTRTVKDYGLLVKRKQQMLVDYQGAVKSLLSRKDQLNTLSAPLRAQLKTTGIKLDNIARQNAEKLSVTAAATHKVLQVVIDTIRREASTAQPQTYSPAQFQSYRDERTPSAKSVLVTEKA